uniref:Uncharacterized protein n=1 Tax=Lactuca sativa TaxID=4236 RepID=A0A9R1VN04_LACSA|nr:hypothetical protein LSAT_V11C400199050 [Lactuca sativa]
MATAAGDSGDCLNHRNLYNHKPTNISSSFHCLHLNPVGCEGLQCRRRSVGEDPKPKQAIAGFSIADSAVHYRGTGVIRLAVHL